MKTSISVVIREVDKNEVALLQHISIKIFPHTYYT
jgi:hypothetical protein